MQQSLGHLTQHAVTHAMTQGVVDVLEAVDVEQNDSDTSALLERLGRAALEEDPIRKSCQRVVGGLMGLAVDLETKLLDEARALEAGAGVGDQCLEKS